MKKLWAVAGILLNTFAAPAWANYSCTGTIDAVTVAPGTGTVIVSSASAGLTWVYLCLLEGSASSANGTVTPEQCKAIYSLLLAAQAAERSVTISFNDTLTCTTHPAWAWLTGWYWGPVSNAN